MHVCHFCDTTFETDFFRNIAAGLIRRGVRVSLVELGRGTPPTWLPEVEGVVYRSLGATNKLSYLPAARRLARFLKDEQVDILHTHLFFAGIVGLLARRMRPKTIVALMRHHTSVVRLLGSPLHIAADRWMAESADRVMTVSEAARAYMIETDRVRRDDIEVVHIGFNFDKISPNPESRRRIRAEFGFGPEDFVIGYVGNFVPGKGHLQLIQAFETMAPQIGRARLLLIGDGMLDDVRSAAEALGPGRVTLAGFRADVPACMNAMDVFVQPSLSEAFSQVLIEAMGTGLAVIATTVGGAREVIRDGENGILIEPGQPGAIVEQTIRLFRDERLRAALGAEARNSVLARFTGDAMVDRLHGLYARWTTGGK